MFSLGVRKLVIVSLAGGIFLLGNMWLIVNWLQGKGWIDWAGGFQRTYLTPTAITIIVVLLILLVKPQAASGSWARHCPVCDHRIFGKKSYCGDCGSKL